MYRGAAKPPHLMNQPRAEWLTPLKITVRQTKITVRKAKIAVRKAIARKRGRAQVR